MSCRLTKCLASIAVQCAACGADTNPFTIEGQVHLRQFADGGTEVSVYATAERQLENGDSEQVLDAGIALNGAPLGPPEVPGSLLWTLPSFAGVGYGLAQTLSVIGSVPEATVTFTCPGPAFFTEPAEGASFSRDQSIRVAWAWQDGGPALAQSFSVAIDTPPDAGSLGAVGIALFAAPGSSSTTFDLPGGIASDARVTFAVTVPGPATSDSFCASVPIRTVLFP